MTYPAFAKIPRWLRDVIVTEKIDGTNGQVEVADITGLPSELFKDNLEWNVLESGLAVRAGSRNRWLTTGTDNFGFARWVQLNAGELANALGEGRHYGEWWGQGIQRGYGLTEKRFSLFNTTRWLEPFIDGELTSVPGLGVVPVLWESGLYDFDHQEVLEILRTHGSLAAPGFMQPEGIVIYHTAGNHLYKVTLENDEKPKGQP